MKSLLFGLALALATPAFAQAYDPAPPAISPGAVLDMLRPAAGFTCANVSCKQLRSCEEACYKLIVCGQSIRDRDHDGIPCENLCSRPCPR